MKLNDRTQLFKDISLWDADLRNTYSEILLFNLLTGIDTGVLTFETAKLNYGAVW